ncbi:PAAR domain-containing protein [Rugamonas sp. DEMB1]|uniref:PAAR domain-containing protein n=1 Tax=Rugamonas sp. DEMB1 TaxID=3039386 RepID=UPI002448E4B1|nr:PAAR domain-containing protein [Rugamonas sp. DEMB1]WGG52411.1 PAAR domain-containing protein [Rugamonas sp. DEMB1]
MNVIGFIVLGDRTSHGGTVISCSTNRYINGIRAARMGDIVMCPRCKRATKIITSRFPKSKDDGIPAAFDMDMTDCGARL